MRYRHYGRLLENLIIKACDIEEGDEKNNLIALICNHMRKDYLTYNKDSMDEQKIADDLVEMSDGKLRLNDEIRALIVERMDKNYVKPRPNIKNGQNQNQNKNKNKKH